jgi:beta-phosphoglucomutase
MIPEAAIFDLDGTLLDNNAYHLKAWQEYLKLNGRELSDEEYKVSFNGRTNKDVVEYLHGRKMTDEEAKPYYLEKEALYRKIYEADIQPVAGLIDLLNALYNQNIPMAIATSGITVNIDFMFSHVPIKKYFSAVVHSMHIKKGKPDPEIYFKSAEILNVAPENCVAFEDALVGIRSAKGAGMKVIALTTTHPAEELQEADKVIKDYTEIDLKQISLLFRF